MANEPSNPPYFDGLFRRLEAGEPSTVAAFGRHVHWGYWPQPPEAACSPEEYGVAAENLCRAVCNAADIRDGMKVLDVGCGFGGTIASLNERFSDLQLTGVNIDPRQLQRAKEMVQPMNGNSLTLVEADAAQIPLDDEGFDVVLAVECIFHFDRAGFLSEAARLLRPGGKLAISDFVPSERALEYLDLIDFSADEGVRWSYGSIDLSCSIGRYRALANSAGLTLTGSSDITAQTLPTYDFLYANADEWTGTEEGELFKRATRKLEKSCRKGLIGYQIVDFERE